MKYIIYSDGGSRGNPGPAAFGFLVFSEENGERLAESGGYLGTLTNNQAEYQGVIHAFQWMRDHRNQVVASPKSLEVRLDSELLVNQLSGVYKIKSPGLQQLVIQVKNLEKTIGVPTTYKYVPREMNADADRLVNKALDEEMKPSRI